MMIKAHKFMVVSLSYCLCAGLLSACASQSSNSATTPGGHSATGSVCGTRGVSACAALQDFCLYQPAQQCGATDLGGICTTRPQICTMDYNPVCGCDGKTYSNACAANAAGVSAAYSGECRP